MACSVDGCERPKKSRGFCTMHYKRWATHGDPLVARPYRRGPGECETEGCTNLRSDKAAGGLCGTCYSQSYREANRDLLRDRYKKWSTARGSRWAKMSDAEKDSYRRQNAQARARRRSARVWVVTDRDLRRLRQRQGNRCVYCDRKTDVMQLDHVLPLIRGGLHSIGNLVYACETCNKSKGSRLLSDWRREVW